MVFPNTSTSLSWIASELFSSSPNFPYRFGPKLSNMLSTQRTVRLPQSSRAKLLTRHSGVTSLTSVTFVFSVPSAMCTTTLLLGANLTRAHFPVSLGARAYGNRCLHAGNIAGFGRKFFQCSNQIHFIHISHVTSTFASNVITNNISFTFEM